MLSHLDQLEAEGIHILREVEAQFARPVMLYSIGKDSSVLLHLARKAFYPGRPPFPLLHVDTTWKFREMIAFRDAETRRLGFELRVHVNQDGVRAGIGPVSHGSKVHTDVMKTQALRQALAAGNYDAVIGGARRDEEASHATERIFSLRDRNGAWDPRHQRPELWGLVNGRVYEDEHMRVFPLSNWTELDVWQYIARECIPVVPLYLARPRPVVSRNGMWILVDDARLPLAPGEEPSIMTVRFRTLGCYPLTAAVESTAASIAEIVAELAAAKSSERSGLLIDHDQRGSMEQEKREGYF
jgi:sulfate adenylyltransferase subunit 2